MARQQRKHTQRQNRFTNLPSANVPRSAFDRSSGVTTTFNAGELVPIFVDEVLPGDTFSLDANMFARFATPLFPFMSAMDLQIHFFAVPNRLLWDNWERFMGAQDDPGDSTDFLIPTMTSAGFQAKSLGDYFGMPTLIPNTIVSALFHRAHNKIFNEWYRDQDLQDSAHMTRDDGPDDPADYPLRKRNKYRDYFTSARPEPQKGEAVTIPLGTTAPVTMDDGQLLTVNQNGQVPTWTNDSGTTNFKLNVAIAATKFVDADGNVTSAGDVKFDDQSGLTAILNSSNTGVTDLSGATAISVNSLRTAVAIQQLLERNARSGTRLVEIIQAHFGVHSPDARMQRSEYLGGGSFPLNINTVAQTSATDAGTPLAELSGYGVAAGTGMGFTKSFTEHCIIMGFVSTRTNLTYGQGMHRMFTRSSIYDFAWPEFNNLGEQTITAGELFYTGVPAADGVVFGYQERFAEYRFKPSQITGHMRSNYAQSLDNWHLGQDFASAPVLNETFIQESPPVDRVIAVPGEEHFKLDGHIFAKCVRVMPTYSVPGLDRF